MNVLQFVKTLPEEFVYAPIYRKGASMLSGKKATGKNPLEESFQRKFKPADVALALERNDKLGAVGLFTGIRGVGWREVEVQRLRSGKPYIILHGRAKKRAESMGIKKIELSISHSKNLATAMVIMYK